MTSIGVTRHKNVEAGGGGKGRGYEPPASSTFDSHFPSLSCSGSILFSPKCFSNFQGSLNLRTSPSHPPFSYPFPRAPTLLSLPTPAVDLEIIGQD